MLNIKADSMCDGGDLDCGSGLLLIIKKHMDPLENGQILEVRSRESSVEDDLPAWCRMVKHELLGSQPGDNWVSYFVKKGGEKQSNSLDQDLEAAKGYQWNVRIRANEGLSAKIHTRNHSLLIGQPADFSPKVDAPSAIDYMLSSLGGCLTVGFMAHASRRNIIIDEMECTLKAEIENVLYHMEIEDDGSPKISNISGTLYVTSPAEEEILAEVWKITLNRSPIYQTLKLATTININLSIVL